MTTDAARVNATDLPDEKCDDPGNISKLDIADELNALAEQADLLQFAISGFGVSQLAFKEIGPLMGLADDISRDIRDLSSRGWPTCSDAGQEDRSDGQ